MPSASANKVDHSRKRDALKAFHDRQFHAKAEALKNRVDALLQNREVK